MLKIYKLVGEEPIIAEFLEETDTKIAIRNPMIPRMRNISMPDGNTCVGLGWSTIVQFVENIEEVMSRVELPKRSIMWEGIPTGEVIDSYKAAMMQIKSLLNGNEHNSSDTSAKCPVPNMIN
jgi:hypothetical protein